MDSDSEKGSVISCNSTCVQVFIRSISPALLNQMKRYLQKYKRIQQFKGVNHYKITLYEDILTIARLKDNQQYAFHKKKNLKQICERVAKQLKRSYFTIKDRLRKKLAQLTNQQLSYLIENNLSLTFRDNTSVINTDDWPQYLKIVNRKNRQNRSEISASDNENVINLDSSQKSSHSNLSRRGYRSANRERKPIKNKSNIVDSFKKRLQQKRKAQTTNVMKQIELIMSESSNQQKHLQSKSSKKNVQIQNTATQQRLYNLQDPIQKEIFLDKVIEKWRNKHSDKSYFDSNKMLMQSKICYNFKQRQYIFLNPQVMRSVWNNLNQQCLVNVIKSKKNEKKEKINKELQIHTNQNKRQQEYDEKDYFSKLCERQDNIMRCKNSRMQNDLNQEPFIKNKEATGDNRIEQQFYYRSPIMQVSQVEESIRKQILIKSIMQNTQRSSEKSDLVKIKNPIKMIEQIASKYDIDKAPAQVRELILKGIAISERLKRQSGQSVWDQKEIVSQQKNKNEIWHEQHQQGEIQKHVKNNSQQNIGQESKPMIYWFNNDPELYEIYQQRPYDMGHLLWTEQQDQLLYKSNENLQQYIDDFKCLINEKTPKYLITRIRFLNINPSVQLYTIISKYLQSDD